MNNLANGILICIYIFGAIPALGRILSGSNKRQCVGNDYENCMYRGLAIHFILCVILLCFWAIKTKF